MGSKPSPTYDSQVTQDGKDKEDEKVRPGEAHAEPERCETEREPGQGGEEGGREEEGRSQACCTRPDLPLLVAQRGACTAIQSPGRYQLYQPVPVEPNRDGDRYDGRPLRQMHTLRLGLRHGGVGEARPQVPLGSSSRS